MTTPQRFRVKSYEVTIGDETVALPSFPPKIIERSCILFWSDITFYELRQKYPSASYSTSEGNSYDDFNAFKTDLSGTDFKLIYGLFCKENANIEIYFFIMIPNSVGTGISIDDIEFNVKTTMLDSRWISPNEIKLNYEHNVTGLSQKNRTLDCLTLEGPLTGNPNERDPISAIYWKNLDFDPVIEILLPYYYNNRVPITSELLRESIRQRLRLPAPPEEITPDIIRDLWTTPIPKYSTSKLTLPTINDKHDRSQSNPTLLEQELMSNFF